MTRFSCNGVIAQMEHLGFAGAFMPIAWYGLHRRKNCTQEDWN